MFCVFDMNDIHKMCLPGQTQNVFILIFWVNIMQFEGEERGIKPQILVKKLRFGG